MKRNDFRLLTVSPEGKDVDIEPQQDVSFLSSSLLLLIAMGSLLINLVKHEQ